MKRQRGKRRSIADSTRAALDALESRFAARSAADAEAREMEHEPFHLAAAVLHVFDPATLRPFGNAMPEQRAPTSVITDSVPAIGWQAEQLRSMRVGPRRQALQALGSRLAMRRALEANPARTETFLQHLFERWVSGESIEPEQLNYSQLENLRQLFAWGLEEFGGLPNQSRVEVARARRASTRLFEHLVDENFVGRSKELEVLREYVGVVPRAVRASAWRFRATRSDNPLLVFAPGGAGKTALIGRFLLDHVESKDAAWFPFAYLPFDSESLNAREPFTVLLAAASQLLAQVDQADDHGTNRHSVDYAFETFQEAVANFRDRRAVLGERASDSVSQSERLERLRLAEADLYQSFCVLLHAVAAVAETRQRSADVPIVLVLDTFEEVLRRTREHSLGLWNMLAAIQRGVRGLRIIMASRIDPRDAQLDMIEPQVLRLGDLDAADAVRMLEGLGIPDSDVAAGIVAQIGANPLTLRLAARVAREESLGPDGFVGIETKRLLVFKLAPQLIRGQLYRRILDHIRDADVRALAHPGMVVRRVTPAVIQTVLAPVCGLGELTRLRTEELFEELRLEHSLVSAEDDGSLRYREEVRRPMLELLARDKPSQVHAIHRAAVAYYASRTSAEGSYSDADDAELIYHSLMLGDRDLFERVWFPQAERFLISAIDELPPEQRVWLAQKMDVALPPEIRKLADVSQWERIAGRRALDALRYDGFQAALSVLSERKDRTGDSPLFAIEARALIALDRLREAIALTERALDGFDGVGGNAGRLAELLWLQAQCLWAIERREPAAESLRKLAELGSSLASHLSRVQALTELLDFETSLDASSAAKTRLALAAELSVLTDSDVASEPSLVRLALTRLGHGFPFLLSRLAPLVLPDWLFIVRKRSPDLREVLSVLEGSRQFSPHPALDRLAASMVSPPSADESLRILNDIVQRIGLGGRKNNRQTTFLADAVLKLMRTEGATLRGATLAGLDAYREDWERLTAPEVSA